jgi:hypothetical protein
MLRTIGAAAAVLALTALTATAQTTAPSGQGQVTTPSGQNSGAGVPGLPGNKSGPAVRRPSDTTGTNPTGSNQAPQPQDTSGIQGKPGNKSGPPARPPSNK